MEEFFYAIFDFLLGVIVFIVKHHQAAFRVLIGSIVILAIFACYNSFKRRDMNECFEVLKTSGGIVVGLFIFKWLCTDGKDLILSQI